MPTYEYLCRKCGTFEQFHSIKTILTKCPQCQEPVERLISTNCNVIFKGSGFHTTDNRSGAYRSQADKEKTPSTTPSTPAPAKTDSKAS
jgi:putative FmdB family regulatory protein